MGAATPFDVNVESRNGIVLLALSGELDVSTTPLFSECLEQAEKDGATSIMLDLRSLTFMDSTGLHAFMRAWDRAHQNGHQLLFVGATPAARRLFELTGTEYILDGREAVSTLDQFTGRSRDDVPSVRRAVDSSA